MALTKIPSSLLDTSGGFDLQGNITLGDNEKIILGTDSDLQIYHDGSNSIVSDEGTGQLHLKGNGRVAILSSADDATLANFDVGGASRLMYAGSTKLATSSTGATVTGNLAVTGDLDITGNVNSYNVTDLDVTDQTITLGAGQTEANSGGSGIIVDGSNASILWDETNTSWDFNESVEIAAGKNIRVNTVNNVGNTANIIYRSSTNTIVGNNASALVIQDGGNVGIGTDSPGHKLSFGANIPSDGKTITVYEDGNIASGIGVVSGVYRNFTNETSELSFGHYAHSDGTTYTEKMRIDTSGNVGIGTDDPSALLHLKDNFSNGVAITLDRTESGIVDNLFHIGVTSSISAANDRMWFGRATTDLTITDDANVGIGTSAIPHGNVGYAKFAIDGTDSNSAGPHVQYTTASNDYPLFQQLNWAHDNVSLNFDSYFNGQWRSSDAGSNFQIYKNADALRIKYDSGIAAGNEITWNPGFVMKTDGTAGIGTDNPQTALQVFGTNPVVRVSDDGTSGYSTLELRQQNTANEGAELMYNSGTGHTHLNIVYDADLKIATNTGSFGTTNTNTRLTVKNDGVIEVGKSNVSTDRIKFVGNTNIFAPNTGDHTQGTRLSLYDAGTTSWYAIGIESNHMWFNADGGIFKFYQQAVQKVHIDGTNPMPLLRVGTDSTNAMTLGSVTAVFPYSGLNLIVATPGAALTVHSGTNSAGTWVNLNSNLSDYLRGTATFSTINTSQQANIIVYLNVATKVYMARQPGWNGVSVTGWTQISNDSTVISDNNSHNVYVRYLPAGTHSLDNDSALYFFEAPIGP